MTPSETVASADDSVVTTDQSVTTTDEVPDVPETVVGTSGEALDVDAAPDEAASVAPEPGASGEETTAVVADTTGAGVEAPVDEVAGDTPSDESESDEK